MRITLEPSDQALCRKLCSEMNCTPSQVVAIALRLFEQRRDGLRRLHAKAGELLDLEACEVELKFDEYDGAGALLVKHPDEGTFEVTDGGGGLLVAIRVHDGGEVDMGPIGPEGIAWERMT